ncbi:MAG: cation-transporting P-type ATPase, partial [candidate division WOR-3 bacterium]
MADWHLKPADAVLVELGSDGMQGLGKEEVERRLERFGPNRLREREGRSPLVILLGQLTSIMVIVLLVAGVISILLREFTDAGAIFAIVVLN